MKVLVQQPALQRATARVVSAVERRNTIPILSNVLLRAEGDRLSITATDLDIEVVEKLPAEIVQEGEFTVSAATLAEIARRAPPGAELAIEWADHDDPRATVKFGRSRYQLPVLPAGDFPIRGDLTEAVSLTLDAAVLHRLLDRVHFAQSTDETRYYLNGVHLCMVSDEGERVLRTVATDGHRMVRDQTPCGDTERMPSVTIPRKAANEMRRILADLKDAVTLEVASTGLALHTGTGRLITKALDGSYPDYERITPRQWDREITIDRALFKEAIKRVSLMISGEKSRSVKMTIADEVLTLTVRNMEAGVAAEEIEVRGEGPSFETGFNAKYLLDLLDQTDADQMLFRVTDPGSPARLDPGPGAKNAEGLVNIVMPVRV